MREPRALASAPGLEVEGDVLMCLRLDIRPAELKWRRNL